jgi:hypothetical protein
MLCMACVASGDPGRVSPGTPVAVDDSHSQADQTELDQAGKRWRAAQHGRRFHVLALMVLKP